MPSGRIIEAYGFDLSPLAQRYDEFVRIAAAAKIERERMRKLRRRATLARRAVAQAVEELGLQGQDSDELRQLVRETAELIVAARACDRSEELGPCREGAGRPSERSRNAAAAADQTCGNEPHGARKQAPQYKYNLK